MAIAFSSIPVYQLPTSWRKEGTVVPSRDACLWCTLSGNYERKWKRKPYCDWEGVPVDPPDPVLGTNCIGEPWLSSEPDEGDTSPCDPPYYDVPAEALVLDLYYSGAVAGRTYNMSLFVATRRWNDGADVESEITEYPFEFTATAHEGTIEEVFSVDSVEGELACCYVDFPTCGVGG